jgi:hypothetical protein
MESKAKKPNQTQKAQLVPLTPKLRVSKSGPRVVSTKPTSIVKPPTGVKKHLEYNFSVGII